MKRKPNQDINQKTTIKHQKLQENCFFWKKQREGLGQGGAHEAPPHPKRSTTKQTKTNIITYKKERVRWEGALQAPPHPKPPDEKQNQSEPGKWEREG